MGTEHKFDYRWKLEDGYPAKGIEKHSHKVFSTFACGGGSTMGYKLAGYDVIGSNDIDPQLTDVYNINHKPKIQYVCPIKDMLTMDLDKQLFNLDIFDGSPPCSTFSTAGLRDKAWGKDKHFREGQAKQILDDLFFDFIDVAERLQPKIIVAENVSGMLKGKAKGYIVAIKERLTEIGYQTQIFLLDSSTMGVPQRRQRVFIIANRMNYPKLKLDFNEKPIIYKEIRENDAIRKKQSAGTMTLLNSYIKSDKTLGDINLRIKNKLSQFNVSILKPTDVIPTITTGAWRNVDLKTRQSITDNELSLASSFPTDYNYLKVKPSYLLGMSVPPLMMAQVANQIYQQWLNVK